MPEAGSSCLGFGAQRHRSLGSSRILWACVCRSSTPNDASLLLFRILFILPSSPSSYAPANTLPPHPGRTPEHNSPALLQRLHPRPARKPPRKHHPSLPPFIPFPLPSPLASFSGLPLNSASPQMPRRGLIRKRPIPHVQRMLAVASGKGGVGKSMLTSQGLRGTPHTQRDQLPQPLRAGVLDLEPFLTDGAPVPLINHGLPYMSMGFLLLRSSPSENMDPDSSNTDSDMPSNTDTPVQLLFDVDWRDARGVGLNVLVVDMPPGTGDVPLTLAQLVVVDGAVIVSTPQDVVLSNVRKGIAMLRKVSVSITGLVLNQASCTSRDCSTEHHPFGPPTAFLHTAARLGLGVLAQLPLVPEVGACSDAGVPYALCEAPNEAWMSEMQWAAEWVWAAIL
ncbi:ParA/MinD ATPase like-domain-containing protein [Mycena rebaudengoi]|nr:ParA/MinD ATPase like-domain-containing protein [Mycena rebaudengoi]